MAAGYSGTPLPKKLGIAGGHTVAIIHEAAGFRDLLTDLPPAVVLDGALADGPDVVVAFYTESDALEAELGELAAAVFPDRSIWLAWPKRTSGVDTDLTGDVVRRLVLATDLVDVKVCAISDVWSGLKVVWRRSAR